VSTKASSGMHDYWLSVINGGDCQSILDQVID
jgi:hypothetical protein